MGKCLDFLFYLSPHLATSAVLEVYQMGFFPVLFMKIPVIGLFASSLLLSLQRVSDKYELTRVCMRMCV